MNHQTSEDAAERILKAINVELVRLPQAQHETILRIVTTELNTWLQAMAAGAQRADRRRRHSSRAASACRRITSRWSDSAAAAWPHRKSRASSMRRRPW